MYGRTISKSDRGYNWSVPYFLIVKWIWAGICSKLLFHYHVNIFSALKTLAVSGGWDLNTIAKIAPQLQSTAFSNNQPKNKIIILHQIYNAFSSIIYLSPFLSTTFPSLPLSLLWAFSCVWDVINHYFYSTC